MEFEFAIHLQYTAFKWNCLTHQIHANQVSTFNHVLVHCIYFATLFVVCRLEVEPEQEATPFVEDPETEPRQQGKQTPLIISIKSHFPLSLAYALFRMITMMRFYRIDEPIPLHELSFCHSSKQTTILADIGID